MIEPPRIHFLSSSWHDNRMIVLHTYTKKEINQLIDCPAAKIKKIT